MKDKKVTIKFIFIILMILIILLLINNLETLQNYTQGKIKGYLDEPINMETGIINNEYFGISNNGDKPEETTTGLNEAIKYAERNNITNVKLEKGIYVVIGYNNSHYRGLTMQSNVNLDLNGSTILQNTNDQYAYANVSMYNIENASISNGIIMGDKDEHIYNEENGHSHEGESSLLYRVFGLKTADLSTTPAAPLEMTMRTADYHPERSRGICSYYNAKAQPKCLPYLTTREGD